MVKFSIFQSIFIMKEKRFLIMFYKHHKSLLLQNATLPATWFDVHTLDLMHNHSSSIAVKSWGFSGRCWLLSDNYVHGRSGHFFAIIQDNIVVQNHVPIFIESLILEPNLNFRPNFTSENCSFSLEYSWNHTVRNLHFLSKNSTLISRENCRFFLGEKLVKMLWFWTF